MNEARAARIIAAMALMLVGACTAKEPLSGAPETQQAARSLPGESAMTGPASWDGRVTLGGPWIAHPDVEKPSRVLIRNPASGQTTFAALFGQSGRGGEGFLLSSEAAAALGLGAGETALVEVEPAGPAASVAAGSGVAPSSVEPVAERPAPEAPAVPRMAGATILYAPQTYSARSEGAGEPPAPQGSGEMLRVATYGNEANAAAAASQLRSHGVAAFVSPGGGERNPLWLVAAGPAKSPVQKTALVEKVKAAGFPDAYFVGQ